MNWNSFSGFEWLLVDFASRFGKDKDQYTDRIQWGAEMLHLFKVDSLAELKTNLEPWINKADDKPHFIGSAIAIWDTLNGKETNWMVAQDAASSGAQLMSTMMRCETGMAHTGVLGTVVPDLYGSVQTYMNEFLVGALNIERKTLKKGMIPHMYNSTAAPRAVFQDDYPVFLKAYRTAVPMAQKLSDALVETWNPHATEHMIVAPDGFEARIPVLVDVEKVLPCGKHSYTYRFQEQGTKKKGKHGTKSNSANGIHLYDAYMLRELDRRCNYDVEQVVGAIHALEQPVMGKVSKRKATKLKSLEKLSEHFKQISIVAIEYVNEATAACVSKDYRDQLLAVLYKMTEHRPFELKEVHDDFSCLANNVGFMKQWYNKLLQETYLGEWVFRTLESLTGRKPVIPPVNQATADAILDAPYSIS